MVVFLFVCFYLFIFLFLLFLSHGSFDLRFSSNDGGKEAQEGGRRHRYNYGEKNIQVKTKRPC